MAFGLQRLVLLQKPNTITFRLNRIGKQYGNEICEDTGSSGGIMRKQHRALKTLRHAWQHVNRDKAALGILFAAWLRVVGYQRG